MQNDGWRESAAPADAWLAADFAELAAAVIPALRLARIAAGAARAASRAVTGAFIPPVGGEAGQHANAADQNRVDRIDAKPKSRPKLVRE
jgi:hypothetical protein